MGGMIAQHMAYIRPRAVRFLGLLATHAGGVRNLFPSLGMLLAGCRLLYNGFDQAVHAFVDLRFHFTDRFLEQVVGGNLTFGDKRSGRGDTENGAYSTPPPSPKDHPSLSSPGLSTPTETPTDTRDSELVRTLSGADLRFLQSKLHQFTNEAWFSTPHLMFIMWPLDTSIRPCVHSPVSLWNHCYATSTTPWTIACSSSALEPSSTSHASFSNASITKWHNIDLVTQGS